MPGLSAFKTDPLTGLENRRVFEDALRHEIKCAHESGRPLGLVVLDLDWLERINQDFGSEAGDEALCRLSSTLVQSARPSDLIARLGGDELAVIAAGVGEPETYLIAERARHEFSRQADPLTGETMSVSCGVAIFPKHGGTPNGLFRRADLAVYGAKQLGRNRTAIYGAEVNAVVSIPLGEGAVHAGGLGTLLSLAEVVDARHFGGRNHAHRVGRYAESIAREMRLEESTIDRVRLAGMLHDVGKVGIAASILTREGRLKPDEQAEMERHPLVGSRIVRNAGFDEIAGWIATHHERPDGRGYPAGLSGDEVPLGARILAVADAYDAMTSDRVYQPAMTSSEARRELLAGAGTQFYPEVVERFIGWLERKDGERRARARVDAPAADSHRRFRPTSRPVLRPVP
jgi:diguanylate cyclase (GGDEF)-like protein/putative nucleotidyltransferase with HDIG domain